jgi:diaminohydroxyphosphoribosylaminopyrimidine deaminase/5-amino-6-(5-phosphoribosylamino)uracil reductase
VVATDAPVDARWMRRALEHARRGLGRTTPNPVVGACVVTDDGVVVGDGAHERAGEAHAEVLAIDEAGALARGATLYCTLEPCVHHGRTGPCTDRIIAAGIRRVVAAMEDPFPLVSGRGFKLLREHGITVEVGIERAAATELNHPFLTTVREERPFVVLKAATSADGRVAAAPGHRTPLTALPAIRHAHFHRAQADAIAVGSETILVDDPLLTPRHVYRERPLARVIFDRRLRITPGVKILTTLQQGPVLVITSPRALVHQAERADRLAAAGATVVPVEQDTLTAALRALAPFDIQSVILEGGASVHQAAWDEGVVDYVQLYVTPALLGPQGVPFLDGRRFSTGFLHQQRVRAAGPDVIIEGYVHRPD